MISTAGRRIIVALDVGTLDEATTAIEELSPYFSFFKVGLELATTVGIPAALQAVRCLGASVFLDLKLHDIPATVGRATSGLETQGIAMFTVHASAGREALTECARRKQECKMLVVTVLTSLNEKECQQIYGASLQEKVLQFCKDAVESGADGIVCSAKELEWVRQIPLPTGFLIVTPGIRPDWAEAQDQKRVLTPREALARGATHLVVGRPLVTPPASVGSRKEAALRLLEEIA